MNNIKTKSVGNDYSVLPAPLKTQETKQLIETISKGAGADINIIKELLANGADLNANIYGDPLLFVATYLGNIQVIQTLIDNGAEINKANKYGITPLFVAVEANNMDITQLLLNNNANVNVTNQFNQTPLMSAVLKYNQQLMKILIWAGADMNIKDKAHMSALDYARSFDDTNMLEGLLNEKYTYDKHQLENRIQYLEENEIELQNRIFKLQIQNKRLQTEQDDLIAQIHNNKQK